MKITIVFYSMYRHINRMAEAVAEGAGCQVITSLPWPDFRVAMLPPSPANWRVTRGTPTG